MTRVEEIESVDLSEGSPLLAAVERMMEERARRVAEKSILPVLNLDRELAGSDDIDALFPKGSVTVVCVRKSDFRISSHLRDLVYAVGGGEGSEDRLAQAASAINADFAARPSLDIEAVAEEVAERRTFGDVTYQNKTLLAGVAVAGGADTCVVSLPYNGGVLDTDAFAFTKYIKHDPKEDLSAAIIIRYPDLSAFERSILDLIPREQSQIHIGGDLVAVTPVVAILLVVAATTMHTACTGIINQVDAARLGKISLSSSRITELGAAASAAELVALRREVFRDRLALR